MQFEKFTNLRSINLKELFRLTHHKFKLNKDLWDSQSLIDCLRTAVREFKCIQCNQEAIIINKNNYECFCNGHAASIDIFEDNFTSSEDLLQISLNKLLKIEIIIALVQERECYFNSNNMGARLTEDDETKFNRLKKKFIEKVNDFSTGIKVLSNRKNVKFFFQVMELYDKTRDICSQLCSLFYSLSFELILLDLDAAILEYFEDDSSFQNPDGCEKLPLDPCVYEKECDLLTFHYLSASKVNKIQSDIHDLYLYAEDLSNICDEYIEVNIKNISMF